MATKKAAKKSAKKVATKRVVREVEKERAEFRQLISSNPNYFGTVKGSKLKAVKKVSGNTKYEQLDCLGFYPEVDLLEAILQVKLPYGYSGSLCNKGSFEYVRFFRGRRHRRRATRTIRWSGATSSRGGFRSGRAPTCSPT